MREPDLTKKRNLIKVLEDMDCIKIRSNKHEWWANPRTGARQAVPHSRKINKHLAESIIKKLSDER